MDLRSSSLRARVALLLIASAALLACGDDTDGTGASAGTSGGAGTPAAGSGGAGAGGSKLDACGIITQADATALFGQPATHQDQDTPIVDPALRGECLWTWDTELSSQLLQFYVWDGAEYHSEPPDGAQPLAIGQDGYIVVDDSLGVDLEWIDADRTLVLSYFNIGDDVPQYATVVEPLKTLAQKATDAL